MGITYTGKLYGIWCEHFAFQYDRPITVQDLHIIKAAYNALTSQQQQITSIYAHAEAYSPYGEKAFLTVIPISENFANWLEKMTAPPQHT